MISLLVLLLFQLLMDSVTSAPLTKLLELNFPLNFLLVFTAPIIYSLAVLARQFY